MEPKAPEMRVVMATVWEERTSSQSCRKVDHSVSGFTLFERQFEEYFGLQSPRAVNRPGNDQTMRADPERVGKDAVSRDQMAMAKDQELTKESSLIESQDDDVGDDVRVDLEREGENVIPIDQTATVKDQEPTKGVATCDDRSARVDSEQEGDNVVANGQMARIEGPESANGSHPMKSGDFLVGDIICTMSPSSDEEGSAPGRDGERRAVMIQEEQPVAIPHEQGGDNKVSAVDNSARSLEEWPLFETAIEVKQLKRMHSRRR